MLAHRLRLWATIKSTLVRHVVFAGVLHRKCSRVLTWILSAAIAGRENTDYQFLQSGSRTVSGCPSTVTWWRGAMGIPGRDWPRVSGIAGQMWVSARGWWRCLWWLVCHAALPGHPLAAAGWSAAFFVCMACRSSGARDCPQTRHIYPMFKQCWASVVDDGPTLIKHWA